MVRLRKWEPLHELSTLHKELDEVFKRTLGGMVPGWFRGEWHPNIESYIKGNTFTVKAEIAGIDPKDVDISIVGNELTIKGERKMEKEVKEENYFLCETSYGAFERTITLPEGVDVEMVHASCKNGILEVTMPAKAEALPRRVAVEVAETKKAA